MFLGGLPHLQRGLKAVKGVGPRIEKAFLKRNLSTVGDLLSLMPVRYQDRRTTVPIGHLVADQECLIAGPIVDVREGRFSKTGRRYFQVIVEDDTGRIAAIWFTFPAHLRQTMTKGKTVQLFGRTQAYRKKLSLVHPEIRIVEPGQAERPEIRPVYPEMDDVKAGVLRRIMTGVLEETVGLPPLFPADVAGTKGLDRPGRLPADPASTAGRPPRAPAATR